MIKFIKKKEGEFTDMVFRRIYIRLILFIPRHSTPKA